MIGREVLGMCGAENDIVALVDEIAVARQLSCHTARGYKSIARNWLSFLGDTPFASATTQDAGAWLSGAGIAKNTASHRLSTMRVVYRHAIEGGLAISNPFASETLALNYRRATLLTERQTAVEPWEIEKILSYAKEGLGPQCASSALRKRAVIDNAIARLHILLSLSFPDIARLRVCDFTDGFAGGVLRVTAADATQRFANLDVDTAAALRLVMSLRHPKSENDAFFAIAAGERAGDPLSPDAIGNRFRRLCKRAEVEIRGGDFRLGLAKAAVEANASASELAALALEKSIGPKGLALIAEDDARAAWERMRMGVCDETPSARATVGFRELSLALLVNKDADELAISIWADGHVEIEPIAQVSRGSKTTTPS